MCRRPVRMPAVRGTAALTGQTIAKPPPGSTRLVGRALRQVQRLGCPVPNTTPGAVALLLTALEALIDPALEPLGLPRGYHAGDEQQDQRNQHQRQEEAHLGRLTRSPAIDTNSEADTLPELRSREAWCSHQVAVG